MIFRVCREAYMSNILFLSVGGGGWPGAMAELKEEGHYIVGTDCREEHHGKYLPDEFYQVPRYEDREAYVEAIREVVETEEIDYITGAHTREFIILQEEGFDGVLAADPDALRATEDKHETYEQFEDISPDFARVETTEELYEASERLGFPDREICIKPCIGSGGRGFRRVVEDYDKTEIVFEHKANPYITLDELAELDFPPLVMMEFLEGDIYHVDILADEGEVVKAVPSVRIEEKWGYGFSLECVDKPEYIEMAERVVEELNLDHNCFIQIKDDKLMEAAGRMAGSGAIGQDLMQGSIALAEGRSPNTEVTPVKMVRYFENVFMNPETDERINARDFRWLDD